MPADPEPGEGAQVFTTVLPESPSEAHSGVDVAPGARCHTVGGLAPRRYEPTFEVVDRDPSLPVAYRRGDMTDSTRAEPVDLVAILMDSTSYLLDNEAVLRKRSGCQGNASRAPIIRAALARARGFVDPDRPEGVRAARARAAAPPPSPRTPPALRGRRGGPGRRRSPRGGPPGTSHRRAGGRGGGRGPGAEQRAGAVCPSRGRRHTRVPRGSAPGGPGPRRLASAPRRGVRRRPR